MVQTPTFVTKPTAIVVMGVSGCGKSTVAERLANKINGRYLDADDLHSQEAKIKMLQGKALSDEDRLPWLLRVGEALNYHQSNSVLPIVACSALTKRYRGVIRNASQRVLFIYLKVPLEVAHKRVVQRQQHFFPAALIESQFATLEAPVELELDCFTVEPTR